MIPGHTTANSMENLAFELLLVGNTLAGLTLVFLGNIYNTFQGYTQDKQDDMRASYRFRASWALAGLSTALISALCAFTYNLVEKDFLVYVGLEFFLSAFVCVLVSAYYTWKGISKEIPKERRRESVEEKILIISNRTTADKRNGDRDKKNEQPNE